MTRIQVDFSDIIGTIRPLHGMNNSDREAMYEDLTPEFKALHAPIVRLHDTGGQYGGTYYVDVPNIFRNFDADPEDPESYDFTLTDLYLKYLVESGCDVCYRLGVTIEHAPKKYRIYPPSDFHKWANVCEHIVRHYNRGWANGYQWNIKYWEIWNEPDGIDPQIDTYGQPMWMGTAQQYYELYSITANLLKEKHPEIRVGGYSACSIKGECRNGKWIMGEFHFLYGFLDYITAPETRAPLDFFSFHKYIFGADPQSIAKEMTDPVVNLKEILKRYGFEETELFNTEWNAYLHPDKRIRMGYMLTEKGASVYAAAMCEMQRRKLVDKAMFYQAQFGSTYSPLFRFPEHTPTKAYHAFRFFNEVYALKNECRVTWENESIYSVAATDKNEGILMLCNPGTAENQVELSWRGICASSAEISVIDADSTGTSCTIAVEELSVLHMNPNSVIMIRLKS